MNTANTKVEFHIIGGIGDILLELGGLRYLIEAFKLSPDNKANLNVYTHCKNVSSLLDEFNHWFDIKYTYYSNLEELKGIAGPNNTDLGSPSMYEEDLFPLFNEKSKSINDFKPIVEKELWERFGKIFKYSVDINVNVIGIHCIGSEFSTKFLTQNRNVPSKYVSPILLSDLIKKINSYRYNTLFYLFGSENDSKYYDDLLVSIDDKKLTRKIIPNFDNDLARNAARVTMCNLVIACDSAIKSLSLADKTKTIVFLLDYEDKLRDDKFITPYEKEGLLKLVRYNSNGLKKEHMDKTFELVIESKELFNDK